MAKRVRAWFVATVAFVLFVMPTASFAQRFVCKAVSKGFQSGYAEFWVNDQRIYRRTGGAGGGRGFNVAVLNPMTGELQQPVAHFDTWISRGTGADMGQLVDFLINQVPPGTIVMIAVCDEAGLTQWDPFPCQRLSYNWIDQFYEQAEALGSATIRSYCYWYGWALIAVKGEGSAQAEVISTERGQLVETSYAVPVEPATWGQIKATYH